jgi:hypothetical protein
MAVIGIDVDHTLARFPGWQGGDVIGDPDPVLVEVVKTLHNEGHTICLWSCRADYVLHQWTVRHGLFEFITHINHSPYPSDSIKQSFDFYIGDEALSWPANPDVLLSRIRRASQGDGREHRDAFFSSHNPRPYLSGVGQAYVDMFEEAWMQAWCEHRITGDLAFLTICSHAKPYSKSYIHTRIRECLYECGVFSRADYIHISNAGIVPASAEMTYPFNAYDWNGELCTPEVTAYHKAAIRRRFSFWLQTYGKRYRDIVIYLRGNGNTCGVARSVIEGASYPSVKLVQADAGDEHYPPFTYTRDVDDCLTSRLNLQRLANTLEKL